MASNDETETGAIASKDETSIGAIEAEVGSDHAEEGTLARVFEELDVKSKEKWYAYFLTRDFYLVLLLGYLLQTIAQ
jgi:hypothetical protein